MRITLQIENLKKGNAEEFEKRAQETSGVTNIDTWEGRAEMDVDDVSVAALIQHLKTCGFVVREQEQRPQMIVTEKVAQVYVDGMTCRSCEITIERKFSKLPWVKQIDVNASQGMAKIVCHDGCSLDLNALKSALASESKYSVRGLHEKKKTHGSSGIKTAERPTLVRLVGLFALALLVWSLFNKLGILGAQTSTGSTVTFAAAIILGLVAGTSSCLAVAGGLLLSSAGKYHERYGDASPSQRMRPVVLFVGGRVLSYGILGGLIGLLGTAFTFSPLVTGGLTLLAAAYMLVMGLEMLHIAPQWLKGLMPRMPKAIGRRIVDAEGKEHWSAPMLLGGATFFLPCGFTQSLQLYALTTGSFMASGLLLAGFALGTAPALLALGWASSSLKGKAGKFFFQFAGALVIILGLFNMQNGLTIAGYPLSMPSFNFQSSAVAASDADVAIADPNVQIEDGTQVIRMKITGISPYYEPSTTYTVKAGVPVRWEIDGSGTGCRSIFQIPKLGIREDASNPRTVITFTPEKPGDYAFSCAMGMFRGTLTVAS